MTNQDLSPTLSTLLAEEFNNILHPRGGAVDSDNDADDERDDELDTESDDDFYGKYEKERDSSSDSGGHYDAFDADSVASKSTGEAYPSSWVWDARCERWEESKVEGSVKHNR